jgi:alpha-galactosidase
MMMRKIKIGYLGGGSKAWARVFMMDLAYAKGLSGEIALYDIDMPAAQINKRIGERINQDPGAVSKWEYQVYENIDDALAGADFVVISILPGTFEEMRSDVHTPEKYGIYQSVGDTVGPAGVIRSMRTVPMYEHFARKIAQNCPSAWVLNLTNPMTLCVKTLYDVFPRIKAFGCCHEVFHAQEVLCNILQEMAGINVNRSEIFTDVSGVNHFTWITSANYQNIDIFQYLPAYIKKYHSDEKLAETEYVKMDLFERYGALCAAGDRHISEFVNSRWYLDSPQQVSDWKFELTTVDSRIDKLNTRTRSSLEMANGEKPIDLHKSDEEAVELMKAILGMELRVSNVNMPNVGQMHDFPLGAVVETNAVFSNDCVVPVMAKPLPLGAKNLVMRILLDQEELYEGIKERDLNKIWSSFINEPSCSKLTLSQGKELFKEMVLNTRKYLDPYFNIDEYFGN